MEDGGGGDILNNNEGSTGMSEVEEVGQGSITAEGILRAHALQRDELTAFGGRREAAELQ